MCCEKHQIQKVRSRPSDQARAAISNFAIVIQMPCRTAPTACMLTSVCGSPTTGSSGAARLGVLRVLLIWVRKPGLSARSRDDISPRPRLTPHSACQCCAGPSKIGRRSSPQSHETFGRGELSRTNQHPPRPAQRKKPDSKISSRSAPLSLPAPGLL